MTQLSSKTLFQTDPWNTYTQIKFMSIQKGKKGCARSSFRFVRTPVLPKFYILSDKEGFAIQLWFKSVKENTNHALCFTALDNSLLYSAFLDDGFLPLIIENKTRERSILWIATFGGKKQSKWSWQHVLAKLSVLRIANHTSFLLKMWRFQKVQLA